jgi:hypothetical protein
VPTFSRGQQAESQDFNANLRDSIKANWENRKSLKERKQFVLEELDGSSSTIYDPRGPPQNYRDLRNTSAVVLGL